MLLYEKTLHIYAKEFRCLLKMRTRVSKTPITQDSPGMHNHVAMASKSFSSFKKSPQCVFLSAGKTCVLKKVFNALRSNLIILPRTLAWCKTREN